MRILTPPAALCWYHPSLSGEVYLPSKCCWQLLSCRGLRLTAYFTTSQRCRHSRDSYNTYFYNLYYYSYFQGLNYIYCLALSTRVWLKWLKLWANSLTLSLLKFQDVCIKSYLQIQVVQRHFYKRLCSRSHTVHYKQIWLDFWLSRFQCWFLTGAGLG